MPITRKISDSSYDIVFWRIEETAEELLSLLNLDRSGNVLTQVKRTAHHLAGRAAMRSLMPDKSLPLVKDEFGKPHTGDGKYHLSVSHSGDYAVAIGSREHTVGIDIERIGDRITRIEDKFVGDAEAVILEQNDRLKALYLIWSAKEAMYKLYGRKALDFRKHLFVDPVILQDTGVLKGRIRNDHVNWDVSMRYELSDEYSLVWTTGTERSVY